MKLCLIVDYSRSCVTAQVAHALAQRCNADIEPRQDLHPRTGAAGYLRSAWEALRAIPGGIAPPSLTLPPSVSTVSLLASMVALRWNAATILSRTSAAETVGAAG